MVDASWVSSLSPVLLVVVVAGEVEVHVEALHDGQDLGKEGVDIGLACYKIQNLLLDGRRASIVATRMARVVSKNDLPVIVVCLAQLADQELQHAGCSILVAINGDGVDGHKHGRGGLRNRVEVWKHSQCNSPE